MIIDFLLQLIFLILSYMCFKSDDVLDFNTSAKDFGKSMNMYKMVSFIAASYIFLDLGLICLYETLCDYFYQMINYLFGIDIRCIISTSPELPKLEKKVENVIPEIKKLENIPEKKVENVIPEIKKLENISEKKVENVIPEIKKLENILENKVETNKK